MRIPTLKELTQLRATHDGAFMPVQVLKHQSSILDDRRILIVGGGFAGITMAWLLERRGFKNISILESENRIGGKIYSYPQNNIPHELGACYTQPAYHSVHELMNIFNLRNQIGVAGRMVHRDSGTILPFGEDVIAQIRGTMGGLWKHLPDKAIGLRVILELQRYKHIHRRLLGSYSGQMPPRPPEDVLHDLSIPFLGWLKFHRLEILIPIFRLFQSAQGYGYLETIPAFYGLMWNTPEVIDIATQQMSGRGKGAALLKAGMSSLLEAMTNAMTTEIHQGKKVTQIHRSESIRVETLGATDQIEVWEADQLIIAAPHKPLLSTINNPTPLETELISSLVASRMTTTLQSSIQPTREKIDSWFDNLLPGRDHRVITQRCSKAFIAPEQFESSPQSSPIERVVYQYGEEEVDDSVVVQRYEQHQESQGVQEHEVIKRCHWPSYFPHWAAQGISDGNPWRLLNMQGMNNTWWIGSSACFESINDVFEYNLRICDVHIDQHATRRLQR